VAAVVALGVLFGSGGVAAAHSVHSAKVTLTIWDFFAEQGQGPTPERPALYKVAEKWAKSHKGVKIDEPVRPNTGFETPFTQGAKAGKAGDIVMFPGNEMSIYYVDHLIQPVHYDTSPYVKAALDGATLHGKTFAYPWALETMMLYYNTKLVPAKLFKGHYTWQGIAKWAKSFASSHPGEYGVAWQWDNFFYDYDFFTPYGGGVFPGNNAKKLLLNTAGAVKGINDLKKFIDDSGTPVKTFLGSNNGDTNAQDLFETGKSAMIFDGPWSDAEWKSAGLKTYAVAAPPAFPGNKYGTPFLNVQDLGVNRYSKHIKLAESLAAYLAAHMEKPLYYAGGRIPALKSVLKSLHNKELSAYGKGMAHSQATPIIPQMNAVWGPAATALTQVLTGAKGTKAALNAAETAIKKAGG
jgi:arabinogalactan oligomer/maltooligosaccharide transport system substrate-binding protein